VASAIVDFRSDEESAEQIVPEIPENGGCAGPVQADVPKPENSGTLIETAIG